MSATTIAYHLRPNKVIEREIFLHLLGTLSPVLPLSTYQYIGFGGPFLEDFRLIEKRIGPKRLVCIERDDDTHARQKYNCASSRIKLVAGELDSALPQAGLGEEPSIVWLDFSDSKNICQKIYRFADVVEDCRPESIVKLTLCAGIPLQKGTQTQARIDRVRNKLRELCPHDIAIEEMTPVGYGGVLLRSIELALSKRRTPTGPKFVGLSSFVYSDGTPMVTVTGIVLQSSSFDEFVGKTNLDRWEHLNSQWTTPEVIDVPVMSLLEQRAVALYGATARAKMGFAFPDGRLAEDQIENFRKYERLYPHFARVDL